MIKKSKHNQILINPYENISNIFFLRYVNYKINIERRNIVIVIIGSCGSGKSWAGLSFAELCLNCGITKEFDINHVHLTTDEFIKQINARKENGKFVLGFGATIILDEAGVNMDARDWFTEQNKKLLHIIETFRWRRLITILTVPDLSFIDKKARKLVTMVFEPVRILRGQKISIIKPKLVNTNNQSGEIFYPFYSYKNPVDKRIYKIKNLYLPVPSTKLRNEYEKKKQDFATNLAETMMHELELSKVYPYTNLMQRRVLKVILDKNYDCSYKDVAKKLDLTDSYAYSNLKYLMSLLKKKYDEKPPEDFKLYGKPGEKKQKKENKDKRKFMMPN